LAGEYLYTVNVSNQNSSQSVSFRLIVSTPVMEQPAPTPAPSEPTDPSEGNDGNPDNNVDRGNKKDKCLTNIEEKGLKAQCNKK
jgi:hypothetical protein